MDDAATIIRHARRRAGLSQRDLADRVGTSQSAIARYEQGEMDPSWTTMGRLLDACGVGLDVRYRGFVDEHDVELAAWFQGLTIEERLASLRNAAGLMRLREHAA